MEWTLEDIEEANRENPDSFYIPSLDRRTNQSLGNLVRLHFIINNPTGGAPRAERMWVKITGFGKESPGKTYIGILTNQPVYLETLNAGDEIVFAPWHIARIIIKQNDPLWLNIGEKMALVSKKCLDKNGGVRWLYREAPDHEEDSGWRLFDGTEDDEYIDDSENIRVLNISYLLDKDPTLITPFRGEIGSAFERESLSGPWTVVEI